MPTRRSVIGVSRSIPMTFVGAIILGLSIAYSVAYLPQNPYIQGFRERSPGDHSLYRPVDSASVAPRGHAQLRSQSSPTVPHGAAPASSAGTIIAAVFFATTLSTSDLFSLNRMWGLAIVGLSVVPIIGYAETPLLVPADLRRHRRLGGGSPGSPGNPLSLLAAARCVR